MPGPDDGVGRGVADFAGDAEVVGVEVVDLFGLGNDGDGLVVEVDVFPEGFASGIVFAQ